MKKAVVLQRKLRRILVVASAVCVSISVLIYVIFDMLTTKEEALQKVESDLRLVVSQIAEEERKIGVVHSSLETFQLLNERLSKGELSLNRVKAETLLNDLKNKYRLTDFQATLGAESVVSGNGFDGRTLQVNQTDITLKFVALSDVHVFAFLDELTKSLSGYFRYYNLSITKLHELTDADLTRMSAGDAVGFVNVEVSAIWLGLKRPAKPDGVATPAVGAGNVPDGGVK